MTRNLVIALGIVGIVIAVGLLVIASTDSVRLAGGLLLLSQLLAVVINVGIRRRDLDRDRPEKPPS
jgi:hypothetical protein